MLHNLDHPESKHLEQELALQRDRLRRRRGALQVQLQKVHRTREVQRQGRRRSGAAAVAVVGYTSVRPGWRVATSGFPSLATGFERVASASCSGLLCVTARCCDATLWASGASPRPGHRICMGWPSASLAVCVRLLRRSLEALRLAADNLGQGDEERRRRVSRQLERLALSL